MQLFGIGRTFQKGRKARALAAARTAQIGQLTQHA